MDIGIAHREHNYNLNLTSVCELDTDQELLRLRQILVILVMVIPVNIELDLAVLLSVDRAWGDRGSVQVGNVGLQRHPNSDSRMGFSRDRNQAGIILSSSLSTTSLIRQLPP